MINTKIFVSSSCIKSRSIEESVKCIAENEIKNIELSGGTHLQKNYINKLIKLKKKYNLNYLVHNYFPPPKKHFLLNIASCDSKIYSKTIKFYKNTIDLCAELKVPYFGMHAGYLIDFSIKKLNKKIPKVKLYNREKSEEKLVEGYNLLKDYSKSRVKIFLENNVLSKANLESYGTNPFFLTTYEDYVYLKKKFNFNILLDLAHLNVSSKSLKKSYSDQIKKFKSFVKYIHISENNGYHDHNWALKKNSKITKSLNQFKKAKYVTLEVYEEIKKVKKSELIALKMLNSSKRLNDNS